MTAEEIAVELKDHDNQIKSLKHRMKEQEDKADALTELATSVKVLAVNMENMAKEQQRQGERLDCLEKEPAETHRLIKQTVVKCITTGIISAVIGAVMTFILSGGLK